VFGMIICFPKHLKRSLLLIFTLRSVFMSFGWIFTAFSLRSHHVFQSQVLISLTPLATVAIENRQVRFKSSSKRLLYAGLLVVISVSYLEIAAHH
jgi:drug/metabolite transporter (DMT)-like permease